DGSVSRRHLQVTYTAQFIEVRDLDSKNGTFFRGARVTKVHVGAGSLFTVGRTTILLLEPQPAMKADEILPDSQFEGLLVGRSEPMLQLYATLRRVARSEATVLITGESGTGKELIARALHVLSPRRDHPFRVVDLAATTGSLLESELFGHKKGSFTGAIENRSGAFIDAHHGTVFLDEIGELDAVLQPRLLRAVERREIKPIGEARYRTVDVRILAATNRDLAAEVEQSKFRADLFHRLAVVVIQVPPLRERTDDIPLLVEYFLSQMSTGDDRPEVAYSTMQMLVDQPWPGNVRQLRNSIERAYALSSGGTDINELLTRQHLDEMTSSSDQATMRPQAANEVGFSVDANVPFKEAKNAIVGEWERKYLAILMKKYNGNISLAARRSGIARVHLHRLLKKHDLEVD
ncbi:MAG: sigma 54-interacting transcriptional regulator, partial [Myxococcota bacterium]